MGVEGAAIATIIAQAVSAALVMGKLLMTREILPCAAWRNLF